MKAVKLVNPITIQIIDKVGEGESIHRLAKKTGFAYSAVYRWVNVLASYGILRLERGGNKTLIFMNQTPLQNKFKELFGAVQIAEKDRVFWNFMAKTKLSVRFSAGTAAVIWTRGGYVTGDFFEKIYHVDVWRRDFESFKAGLKKRNIGFGRDTSLRPFVNIRIREGLCIEKKNGLPVMPLKELTSWCRRLNLEPVLEQLDLMYHLGLKVKYSEVFINV